VQPLQQTVKGDEACAPLKDAIEARSHFTASTPRRREPVVLQVGIEPPDQPADTLLCDTLLVSERLQLVHQAFGVDPYVDGPRAARCFLASDRIACIHMSGLLVRV